jgi:hypothetical protein
LIQNVAIDRVKVGERKRKLDQARVAQLAESIGEVGLLNPITIDKDGRLVAGRHRLEACRKLGYIHIQAMLLDGSALHAELAEIDENLVRNDLTALEQGEHLARRDEILTALGLRAEVGQGRPPKNGESDSPFSPKTTADIAAEVGLSKRTAQQRKQAATSIPEPIRDAIRDTPTADKQSELLKLSRMPEAEQQAVVDKIVSGDAANVNQATLSLVREKREAEAQAEPVRPTITLSDWREWLPQQPDCDLLLTDPPYMTDVDDIAAFAAEWLPLALAKVKPTGRAYVCIGAYPEELRAYLAAASTVPAMILANILVWTYRNTLGPSPTLDYKQNWQAILYFRGPDAAPLNCPVMTEQFSVQDINAPDGRMGDRYHTWQKPDELAERLIRHATNPGDLVLDPFAGTGTFILMASRLGREGRGCDSDLSMIETAVQRGCVRG